MYSYIKETAKGIKKNITHENHHSKTIRSQNHELGSYEINKVSLSCFDDKRCIHDNGKTSFAYGHYKIA